MKTNIKLALLSALTLMIAAQPAHGMQFVTKGIEKAKANWKPLAIGTIAVVGVYGLWKIYNSNQIAQKELNKIAESHIISIIEQCKIIQSVEKNKIDKYSWTIYCQAGDKIALIFQNLAKEQLIQHVLLFNDKQLSRESQNEQNPLFAAKDLIANAYNQHNVETFKKENVLTVAPTALVEKIETTQKSVLPKYQLKDLNVAKRLIGEYQAWDLHDTMDTASNDAVQCHITALKEHFNATDIKNILTYNNSEYSDQYIVWNKAQSKQCKEMIAKFYNDYGISLINQN